MGGKGGGGGNDYYNAGPDTSGYGTPEEAKLTLAREAPVDYSKYKQNIDAKRAAAAATAKPPPPPVLAAEGVSNTKTDESDTGAKLAKTLLPPVMWAKYGQGPDKLLRDLDSSQI